jgi:hypothetical protein
VKPSAAAILTMLRQRGPEGVSPAEARLVAGCDRLAARVCELRADGFDITTRAETRGGATYARYVLHTAPAQLSLLDPAGDAAPCAPRGRGLAQRAERRVTAGSR